MALGLVEIEEKSAEKINNTIKRISFYISVLSLVSSLLYLVLSMYTLSIIVAIIGMLYLTVYYINKKGYSTLAKFLVLLVSNIGVVIVSLFLGFESGIYLYIFVAPQLIYLLFKSHEKKIIFFCLIIYFITFLIIFFNDFALVIKPIKIDNSILDIIYTVNFIHSFIISFGLIVVFANNNESYIALLKEMNNSLEAKQIELSKEIEQKQQINDELSKSLQHREILLQEVHHRVKNNLAIVAGVLDLQNVFIKDELLSSILKDSKNRIKTIALLHEKLYSDIDFEKINFKKYISELIEFINVSYTSKYKEITLQLEIDEIDMSMEYAIPFSLLLNELITNSYKHAFKHREKGCIFVGLGKEGNELKFKYADDGEGFTISEKIDSDSIGINLINAFAAQLDDNYKFYSNLGEGCVVELKFNC